MCGRYTLTSPHDAVASYFETGTAPQVPPRYNLAPTQESVIVTSAPGGGSEARRARWGFALPHGGKSRLVINARGESVASRPAFRDSFRERRCLVPANGFFEWARIGRIRQPFYFTSRMHPLIAFAGLWSEDDNGRSNYVILTTNANDVIARVHERMPLILGSHQHEEWLDPKLPPDPLSPAWLRPWPASDTRCHPVGLRVNDVACDDESCLRPLEGPVDLFPN